MLTHMIQSTLAPVPSAQPRQGLARFRETVGGLFPPLLIKPDQDAEPRFSLKTRGDVNLQVSLLAGSSHSVERRPGVHVAKEHLFYKIGLQISGTATLIQGNKESTMGPGGIALCDTGRSYDLHLTENFAFVVAQFPKDSLRLPDGLVNDLSAELLSGDGDLSGQLEAYLRTLGTNLSLLNGPAGSGLVRGFLDLVAAMLGERVTGSNLRITDGAPATLMQILTYIDDHLADPDLTPASIAAAHFLSTRHLYNLFAPTGESIAQWVKKRRLETVRQVLEDPAYVEEPIFSLARRWGFEDPSYFSRIFKERYGFAPGVWRSLKAAGNS